MAEDSDLYGALRRADAAGDIEGARKLASYIATRPSPSAAPEPAQSRTALQTAGDALAGAVRGAGSIGATLLAPVDIAKDALDGKGLSLESNRERRKSMDEALASLGADTNSTAYTVGKVGAEIAGTAGAGGVVARALPVAAGAASPLANAIASGGTRAGTLAADATLGAKAADLGTRVAGGAISGAASAGLADPESAVMGGAIGAALPPALSAASKVGQIVGSAVAPFTTKGADRVVGRALNEFATDPAAAQAALRAAPEVVPGSLPTTAAAAGDIGLSGLQRTLANRNPAMAAELAERGAAQNEARTRVLETIAGNPAKIAEAQQARDAATAAMRESALDAAGAVPAGSLLAQIDQMIATPGNKGLIVQKALRDVRRQIGDQLADGAVDARGLYAVRKDINDVLGGRLQGDAANKKFASSQLIEVKNLLDSAIDSAAQRGGGNTSWRGYLDQYSQMSRPIEQMQILDDVLKRVQTGSMDTRGTLQFSAARLNNILKNEGQDLAKKLTPDQMDILRNVQSDLNASVLANTAGKTAVGSNTAQNLASDQFLTDALGRKLGGSRLAQGTLGRLTGFVAKRANEAIEDRLGQAMLDPNTAALLMDLAKQPELLQRLGQSAGAAAGARALPVIATSGQR